MSCCYYCPHGLALQAFATFTNKLFLQHTSSVLGFRCLLARALMVTLAASAVPVRNGRDLSFADRMGHSSTVSTISVWPMIALTKGEREPPSEVLMLSC